MTIEKLAGCLIIDKGKILLVKEAKDWYWKIPSGKVDRNESLEKTAIRETKEETGLEVDNLEYFKTYHFNFKEREFILHIYMPKIIKGIPKAIGGDTITEVKWFPIKFLNQENSTPSNKLIYNNLR